MDFLEKRLNFIYLSYISKKQVMLVFRMQEIQKIQWILGCSEIIRFLTSTEFSCQKIDYNFRAKELIAILGSRKFIISLALKTKGFFCSEELLMKSNFLCSKTKKFRRNFRVKKSIKTLGHWKLNSFPCLQKFAISGI